MFGRSVEYKAKCRAIFINSIYILLDHKYLYDDSFKEMINNFVNNYATNIKEIFELMYDFKYNEAKVKCVKDNPEIDKLCLKYLSGDMKNVYNSVKESDIKLISRAAELFYEYINYMALLRYDSDTKIKH